MISKINDTIKKLEDIKEFAIANEYNEKQELEYTKKLIEQVKIDKEKWKELDNIIKDTKQTNMANVLNDFKNKYEKSNNE